MPTTSNAVALNPTAPKAKNGKVTPPQRVTNAVRRIREHLTPDEVEKLIMAAGHRSTWPSRRGTGPTCLPPWVACLRSRRATLGSDRFEAGAVARESPEEWRPQHAPITRTRVAVAQASPARLPRSLCVLNRAWRSNDHGHGTKAHNSSGRTGQTALPYPSTHAPPRVRLQAR